MQWRIDRCVASSQAHSAPALGGPSAAVAKCLLTLQLHRGPQVTTVANDTSTQNTNTSGKALILALNKMQVDELLATLEIIQQQIEVST